jgi:hypothetical protein
MECMHQVDAIVILDNEGKRLFGKYFNNEKEGHKWHAGESQTAFEASTHSKIRASSDASQVSSTSEGDVMIMNGNTIVYLCDPELTYLVVGGGDENELVLGAVLSCLIEAMQTVAKISTPMDLRGLLEGYDALVLIVDEMIDDGIILDVSASDVAANVVPYLSNDAPAAEGAKKAFSAFSRYLKQNL